jgi:hypothetical protein
VRVLLGFGLSYLIAYTNSKPYKQRRAGGVGVSRGVGGSGNVGGSMLNQGKKKVLENSNSAIYDEKTVCVCPKKGGSVGGT